MKSSNVKLKILCNKIIKSLLITLSLIIWQPLLSINAITNYKFEPLDTVVLKPNGIDDTKAFKDALLKGNKIIKLLEGKTYIIKGINEIVLSSNTKIMGNRAKIIVPSEAKLTDFIGQNDTYYNNAVFRVYPMVAINNFSIENVNFVLEKEKVNVILIGDAKYQSGDVLRKDIRIEGCSVKGNGNLGTSLFLGNNCEVNINNNIIEDTGFGIYGVGNKGNVSTNRLFYIGVSRDLKKWANSSGIRFYGAKDMKINKNNVIYTGGTAISVSVASTSGENIIISENLINNAGLSAIAAHNKGGEGYLKNVKITSNIINGYNCAIDGDLHSGIHIGNQNKTSAGFMDNITIKDNYIDFIGTFEKLSLLSYRLSGNKNPKKNHNIEMGASEVISCRNDSGSIVKNILIEGNTIKNAKTRSIHVSKVNGINIINNRIIDNGWERNDRGQVIDLKGNMAIRSEKCIKIDIKNNSIYNSALPSNEPSSQKTGVIMSNQNTYFNISNNKYSSLKENNNAFLVIVGGLTKGERYRELGYSLDYIGKVSDNYSIANIPVINCNIDYNYNLKLSFN